MCKYCTPEEMEMFDWYDQIGYQSLIETESAVEDSPINNRLTIYRSVTIEYDSGKWFIQAVAQFRDHDGNVTIMDSKPRINYCPMCGRKLEEV